MNKYIEIIKLYLNLEYVTERHLIGKFKPQRFGLLLCHKRYSLDIPDLFFYLYHGVCVEFV